MDGCNNGSSLIFGSVTARKLSYRYLLAGLARSCVVPTKLPEDGYSAAIIFQSDWITTQAV